MANVPIRKIWVKRAGASATQVLIKQDDLVDDVRDAILLKYGNSLGRSFDTPDLTLRIIQRVDDSGAQTEFQLGPEQDICRILDAYYPGGQKLDEALVIHVPQSQLLSPRLPLSPKAFQSVDHNIGPQLRLSQERNLDRFAHMSSALARPMTPRLRRQQTIATAMISRPFNGRLADISDTDSDQQQQGLPLRNSSIRSRHESSSPGPQRPAIELTAPSQPSVPTKPESRPSSSQKGSAPATPSLADTHPQQQVLQPQKTRRPGTGKLSRKKSHQRKLSRAGASPISPSIGGSVPPINVLIVEDNNMTLRVLERVMQRLKVRWQTAANGRIGVDKWRSGGFHLVLMDIQMPIMTGLEATQEIRRLERLNGIGVFSLAGSLREGDPLTAISGVDIEEKPVNPSPDDNLPTSGEGNALTASSGSDIVGKPPNLPPDDQLLHEDDALAAISGFDVVGKPTNPPEDELLHEGDALTAISGCAIVGKPMNLPPDNDLPTSGDGEELPGSAEGDTLTGTVGSGIVEKPVKLSPDDKLPTSDEGFFNSPTIIVALTASSLESDRHEALAAGCNDFLTKPVDLVWMEQKIKEWGCMQALIDFKGWRKWRSSQ